AGPRDLQGDGAVQLRVARLEHGAEAAAADGAHHQEFAEAFPRVLVPGGGGKLVQTKAGSAAGARDLARRRKVHQLDGILAVRTADVHDWRSQVTLWLEIGEDTTTNFAHQKMVSLTCDFLARRHGRQQRPLLREHGRSDPDPATDPGKREDIMAPPMEVRCALSARDN